MLNVELLNLILTIFGILFITIGLITSSSYTKILRNAGYSSYRWYIIILMKILFICGYSLNLLLTYLEYEIINPNLVVSIVYFFGSIYVIISTFSTKKTVLNIIGDNIGDDEAYELFLNSIDINLSKKKFKRTYGIICENCNEEINYSILQIVKNNSVDINNGISIIDTFGVKNYILRPTHKCKNQIREISVIHDHNFAYRSIKDTRIVVGDFV